MTVMIVYSNIVRLLQDRWFVMQYDDFLSDDSITFQVPKQGEV